MTQVAVYNPGGATPLTRVPLRHAIGMLQRRVATILEEVPGERFGPYPKPRALVLIRYVYEKWKWSGKGPVRYSKRGVLARDCHRCAYCGRRGTTIDHVLPRCQGGKSTWLNCVAACEKCNGAKKGRTPEQAGMKFLPGAGPFVPTRAEVWGRER